MRNELSQSLRRAVAEAWSFRWEVELEAELRFNRLAQRLARIGALPVVVELAARASSDERRHAALCGELAVEYGADSVPSGVSAREISPPALDERDRVLYEVVAACCVTETESVSVLTTLVNSVRGGRMQDILRELLRDEVSHSRLGWAHLAHQSAQRNVHVLDTLIPNMLEGSVAPGLFQAAREELESPELLAHGVLPHSMKRAVFTTTLLDVVFPGLESLGVHAGPAHRWLDKKMAASAQPS